MVAGVWITSSTAQQKPSTSGLSSAGPVVHGTPDDPLRDLREAHFRHVQQLTFGGQNAEAYFSPVDRDGQRLERITPVGGFQAFPMFSPDGKRLVFASNRNAKQPHEINIFIADWVP